MMRNTISLSPLSDEDTARLLGSLLQRAVLPAETQRTLLVVAGLYRPEMKVEIEVTAKRRSA